MELSLISAPSAMSENSPDIVRRKRKGYIAASAVVTELFVELFTNGPSEGCQNAGRDISSRVCLTNNAFFGVAHEDEAMITESKTKGTHADTAISRKFEESNAGSGMVGAAGSGKGKSVEELLATAQICFWLQRALPGDYRVYHQIPPMGGKIDVGIYLVREEEPNVHMPLAVLEAGKERDACRSKAPPLLAYINNHWVSFALDRTRDVQLGITCEVGKTVCLKAFYRAWEHVENDDVAVIGEVDIFQAEWSASAFARILQAINFVAGRFKQETAPCHGVPTCLRRHSVRIANDVYKVFDNRNSTATQAHQASVRFLSAEVVVNAFQGRLVIIKYPHIDGSHIPHNYQQFHHIMEELMQMHSQGWVHGDIRLANMIFHSENNDSRLIDFDFAGVAGTAVYPAGYNHNIKDGFRHRDAVSAALLQPLHDVYSLGCIIGQLFRLDLEQVSCEETKATIEQQVTLVADLLCSGDLVAAVALSGTIGNHPVALSSHLSDELSIPVFVGTFAFSKKETSVVGGSDKKRTNSTPLDSEAHSSDQAGTVDPKRPRLDENSIARLVGGGIDYSGTCA
jgi:hypothetical protein